jgi:nitrate reductase NapE component
MTRLTTIAALVLSFGLCSCQSASISQSGGPAKNGSLTAAGPAAAASAGGPDLKSESMVFNMLGVVLFATLAVESVGVYNRLSALAPAKTSPSASPSPVPGLGLSSRSAGSMQDIRNPSNSSSSSHMAPAAGIGKA